MKILGVLPLAGSGVRLGVHFHKSLIPFPSDGDLVPIVATSIARLSAVTDKIVSIVSSESKFPFPSQEFGLHPLEKDSQGELPTSIKLAAEFAFENNFSHIAVSLPDTFWLPANAFELLAQELTKVENLDGVLGLFEGDLRMLDLVTMKVDSNIVDRVTLHLNHNDPAATGLGWGIFILTAQSAKGLTDDLPLADQLSKLHLAAVPLTGEFLDIGTPKRYFEAVRKYS
jgi:hypothetical protein